MFLSQREAQFFSNEYSIFLLIKTKVLFLFLFLINFIFLKLFKNINNYKQTVTSIKNCYKI